MPQVSVRSCYANSKNAILIIERRTKEVKEEEEATAKKNGKRKKESLRVSGGFNGAQAAKRRKNQAPDYQGRSMEVKQNVVIRQQ